MRRHLLITAAAVTTTTLGLATPGLATPGVADASPRYGPAVSHPVEDPYYPTKGDPGFDALHYGLDLRWSPSTRILTGKAVIRFRAPKSEKQVRLDLGDPLRVQRVALDGHRRAFSHPGKDLVVRTGTLAKGSRHTLTVLYRGRPRPVAAPTGRTDIPGLGWTTTRRGEVWAMQEPFGAFTWYPVNDQPSDKAYYDLRIDAPAGMVGVANGRITHRRTAHGRTVTRWHLASPAASYLTTIAIGDYVRHTDRGPHHLPITYWLPRHNQKALAELRRTPSMIRWLESRLGRYPFDRIGTVVVPSDSAMETQTMVTMGSRLMLDRRQFRADLLHEYAHQWYGDTVTPDTWPDLWLNESFAMYIQIRWEVSRGWSTMADWRDLLNELDPSLRHDDGPPGAYHKRQFGETCVYYCGARMLDRLRTKIGAAEFDSALRAWPQRHRFASVDRADYSKWISARTNTDLGPFLNLWLTSTTSPS